MFSLIYVATDSLLFIFFLLAVMEWLFLAHIKEKMYLE